jgi:hypothetical protein
VPVLKRGIDTLASMKKYVKGVAADPPKNSNNYILIKKYLKDDFLEAKMHFLLSIAEECHPFLLKFQSNAPLFPFLHQDMYNLIKIIGSKFLKKVVFDANISEENLISANKVDIGFGAKQAIKSKKLVDVLEFKTECQSFLREIFVKLINKCPLTNPVVKGASALNPQVMTGDQNKKESRITTLLEAFVGASVIEASSADRIKREYLNLCKNPEVVAYLKKYVSSHRLDEYIVRISDFYPLSKELMEFFTTIFILFHSNAAVERSFSVNKECLIDNLTEESLIAQRIVYDAMKEKNNFNLQTLQVSTSMIQYFKNASSRRKESLQLKKEETKNQGNERNRINQELLVLKVKKQKLIREKEEELNMLQNNITFLQHKLEK